MPTNEKLAEPIVNALMAIVLTNLPAALVKASNSYNDGILLPMPGAGAMYFGERLVIPEYPAIVFDFEAAAMDSEEFANLWASYTWTISVDVIVQSDDETILARQLARYSRAIWEVVFGNQIDVNVTGQAQAISVKPKAGMRSPLVPTGQLYFKGWRWLLDVARIDDLS